MKLLKCHDTSSIQNVFNHKVDEMMELLHEDDDEEMVNEEMNEIINTGSQMGDILKTL